MTTTRRRTTAVKEHGRQDHIQGSSNGDRVEQRKRADGQEESNNAREGWSGVSAKDLVGSETEEEAMNEGGTEGGRETLTAMPLGTQDCGAGTIKGDVRARRGNIRKSPSATAN